MSPKVAVAFLALAVALSVSSILSAAEPTPAGTVVEADGNKSSSTPGAAERAQERRRTFIGIVGFAAMAFGLSGLWLLRRARRNKAAPEPIPLGPEVTRVGEPPEPPVSKPATGTMVCPTCRADYTAEARFCKLDGNRLISVREGTDPRGPAGGICPVCGQGYDPGIPTCPVHQEELVPAALYQAQERASGSFPKICPTCGVQYANGSGFCGADGSALVTVN